jgi:quercetin dioxygenase-like cupin family protein
MKSKLPKTKSADGKKITNKQSNVINPDGVKTKGTALTPQHLDGEKTKGKTLTLQKGIALTPQYLDGTEIEKGQPLIIVEILEYISNSVLSKTIIKNSTGNISVMSFDTGEGLGAKTSPFDTFAQIIDGTAEIVIDEKSHILKTGQAIIIPANTQNIVKANERFKMILTILKSGYE